MVDADKKQYLISLLRRVGAHRNKPTIRLMRSPHILF